MSGRALITGASGFVGRALVNELAAEGRSIRAAMRQPADVFPDSVEVVAVSDLTRSVEWRPLLKGVDTVVHLAGIAHSGPGIADDIYDRVNRVATTELAAAARAMGLSKLVFISSIRAQTGPTAPRVIDESDVPVPTDSYGRSKLAAEEAIRASNASYTILRPVLVYGDGAKGNLASLMQLTQSHWPLPFGLFRNRRSLLARQNLVSAIRLALDAPATANQTYVVADPRPVTLAEIVTALRRGEGRRSGLLPMPPILFGAALKATGRAEMWDRIGGTLVVDPAKLLAAGWKPAVDTLDGLAAMAQAASPRKSGTASRRTP
jgi:UDP-glucose 4-epimerase